MNNQYSEVFIRRALELDEQRRQLSAGGRLVILLERQSGHDAAHGNLVSAGGRFFRIWLGTVSHAGAGKRF